MNTTTLTTIRVPFTATAVEPIHHGAGTSGNTSLLRTQEAVGPDGQVYAVPFVSGNSIRHRLRAASADHLLACVEAPPRSLSKAAVDLLYSGGALTKTGANVDLETPRRVADLVPSLTLFGYSAGSAMQAGKLFVDNAQLVCVENAWRLPDRLGKSEQAKKRAGVFRGEEFGTRHDAARSASGEHYSSLLEAVDAGTTQMIYDFQVLKPGAVLFSEIAGVNLTGGEAAALLTALDQASMVDEGQRVMNFGAKSAVGFGKVAVDFDAGTDTGYEQQLRDHRAEILELIETLVA